MKPTILLEGPSAAAIVEALLPPDVLTACDLLVAERRSTLASVARTHLIKHRAPIAVILDTDTLDPTAIAELVRTTRHLIGSVAGDTPHEILYCVPHIEAIFFESGIDLGRIFPHFEAVFVLPFAKTQPKDQLQLLFEKGGGPPALADFLGALNRDDVAQLRSTYPISRLIDFIKMNREAAA